jgi:hypothetical protein
MILLNDKPCGNSCRNRRCVKPALDQTDIDQILRHALLTEYTAKERFLQYGPTHCPINPRLSARIHGKN